MVARLVRDQKVAGSNPVTSTTEETLEKSRVFLFSKKHRSEIGFEEAVMNEAAVRPQNGADRRGVEPLRITILSPRPEKAGNRKDSGSFFIHFAQSAVFGAFFMQRMCNLGERAKDTFISSLSLLHFLANKAAHIDIFRTIAYNALRKHGKEICKWMIIRRQPASLRLSAMRID